MSIIPLLVAVPIKIPIPAIINSVRSWAARAPIAGGRKETTALDTPVYKSNTAKAKRKNTITI